MLLERQDSALIAFDALFLFIPNFILKVQITKISQKRDFVSSSLNVAFIFPSLNCKLYFRMRLARVDSGMTKS